MGNRAACGLTMRRCCGTAVTPPHTKTHTSMHTHTAGLRSDESACLDPVHMSPYESLPGGIACDHQIWWTISRFWHVQVCLGTIDRGRGFSAQRLNEHAAALTEQQHPLPPHATPTACLIEIILCVLPLVRQRRQAIHRGWGSFTHALNVCAWQVRPTTSCRRAAQAGSAGCAVPALQVRWGKEGVCEHPGPSACAPGVGQHAAKRGRNCSSACVCACCNRRHGSSTCPPRAGGREKPGRSLSEQARHRGAREY